MNEALRDWVDQCRRHLLPDRHRRRPAPLSGDGARLPVGDRQRGARADAWRPRAACPTRWSPASAAARTPSACSIRSSTTARSRSIGVEAGGHGLDVENGHAASMTGGRPGVLHGNRTYLLQDDDGQILEGHSISAGLDYPGIGPEHSWLQRYRPRQIRAGHRQGGARGLPALHRASKASSRRSSRRTRWPTSSSSRRRMRQGPDHRDEHVRPRRQGHLHRRQASGDASSDEPPASTAASPALQRGGPRRARHLSSRPAIPTSRPRSRCSRRCRRPAPT